MPHADEESAKSQSAAAAAAMATTEPLAPHDPRLLRDRGAEFAGLGLTLLAVLVWSATDLDMVVARWFGTSTGFWPLGAFAHGMLHTGALGAAWCAFLALLLNVWRPLPLAGGMPRPERWRWVLTTAASLALVLTLRHQSVTSCPWALADFGGTAGHWVPPFHLGQSDGGPGQCLPSAHAAVGFAFVSGWHALRHTAPRAARRWLVASVSAGLVLSSYQVTRGAHFVSHCLWSGWLCWACAAVSFQLMPRLSIAGLRERAWDDA